MNLFIFSIFLLIASSQCMNKYSEEANKGWSKKDPSVDREERPFRMMKINQLWEKALKRLSGQKLKNLKSDLKQQDKEELSLKQVKTSGQDKEGLKEAQIRKNLQMIISKYGLTDGSLDDAQVDHEKEKRAEKQLFKDKKLDKLWRKAEAAGFSEEELKVLKEEFKHHQERVDEYYQLMNVVDAKEGKKEFSKEYLENSVEPLPEAESKKGGKDEHGHQALKEKHKELKSSFGSLKEKVVTKRNVSEFEEDNVQRLWNLAKKSDFTGEELESLKEELLHYQHRVKKLKYFEEQLHSEKLMGKHLDKDSTHETKHLKKKVDELSYKAEKLHRHLETKILQRHVEL